MKKLVSYKVDAKTAEDFKLTCNIMGKYYGDVIEKLMLDFINKEKNNINHYLNDFWNSDKNFSGKTNK